MPLINFSGLASGIDSNALIKATSDAARAQRVLPNQKKIQDLTDTNDALTQFKSLLTSLQTSVKSFSTLGGGILAKRAVSSDETVLTTSANSNAINGSSSITVTRLAASATFSFANENGVTDYAYPSADTAISPAIVAGPHDIAVAIGLGSDQQTFNISVGSTTTLNQFVTAFNNATTKAVATVTNVGTAASPDYRVIVTGSNSGTQLGYLSITVPTEITDPTGLAADRRWNNTAANNQATDAEFSITGISGTITRSSNTISDILPGVTFTLKDTGGPVNITVSDDTNGTKSKINDFISKYNAVVAFIKENNQVTREDNGGNNPTNVFSPLALTRIDDNAQISIQSAITSSRYYNTGDSSTATNAIRIFADVGVITDSSAYDPTTKTGGGTLKLVETSSSTIISGFSDAISKEPNSVNKIFTTFGDAAGVTAGVIDLYSGPSRLIETTIKSNKKSIDDLNTRIAAAETSIAKQEEQMRTRFANLESTISKMQSQQSSLSSALASLQR